MNIVLFGLLGSLVALTVVYAAFWLNEARKARRAPGGGRPADRVFPGSVELAIGFVTDFFDTLGIGNFATTTAAFKLFRLVPDEQIPGTLNVGHTIPVVAEALIYVAIIQVDMTTLVAMIAAAVAGAWLGAGIVARLPAPGHSNRDGNRAARRRVAAAAHAVRRPAAPQRRCRRAVRRHAGERRRSATSFSARS